MMCLCILGEGWEWGVGTYFVLISVGNQQMWPMTTKTKWKCDEQKMPTCTIFVMNKTMKRIDTHTDMTMTRIFTKINRSELL